MDKCSGSTTSTRTLSPSLTPWRRQLNEAQLIHEHDQVQGLIFDLTEAFTQKYGDYVLWGEGLEPTPLEEFLRKAQPSVRYCIGAVLVYKH